MKIIDKVIVGRMGAYTICEGDIDDGEIGDVTMCWVEKNGEVVSTFGSIDSAYAYAEWLVEEDFQVMQLEQENEDDEDLTD